MKKLTTIITTILAFFSLTLPTFAQITIGNTGQATGINLGNINNIRLPNPDPGAIVMNDEDYNIILRNNPTETGKVLLQVFSLSTNFTDTITTDDYTITLSGEKGKNYITYTASRNKNNYYCESPHNTQIFTVPLPTVSVFNTTENSKVKIKVSYSECKNKDPITAYFTPTEVQYGATTWNLTLHTTERATIDQQQLQYWTSKFNIHQVVNSGDNMIIITMTPNNTDRLEDIECTAYNLTIPRNALTSAETLVKNTTDIIGEFRVTNCPPPPTQGTEASRQNGQDGEDGTNTVTNTETGTNTGSGVSTIKEGNLYLSILDADENGKQYVNITNLVYLLGIISFFLILFFVLFGFLKNSFLGRSKKY